MSKHWFYVKAGTQDRIGPVSHRQMVGLIQQKALADQDYIWTEGMQNWSLLVHVKDKVLAAEQPASSTPQQPAMPGADVGGAGMGDALGGFDLGGADMNLGGGNLDFDIGSGFSSVKPVPRGGYGGGGSSDYAGFWRRWVAYVIDSVIIGVVFALCAGILWGAGLFPINFAIPEATPDPMASVAWSVLNILTNIGTILYFVLMESSAQQGTLGKMPWVSRSRRWTAVA